LSTIELTGLSISLVDNRMPAMAVGISNHVWTTEEIVSLLD